MVVNNRIGIIGAMDAEVDLIKAMMTIDNTTTIADMEFVNGVLSQKEIVVVKCGMGKINAAICATTLIERFHVNEIINIGVAGSLNSDINIGDIVISTEAVQHDFDVSLIGFQKGEVPYTGLIAFPADENLIERVKEAAHIATPDIQTFAGRICSGDQFIASKSDKERILKEFGGLCCEMEGAAIAQTCYLHHVPYVIVRAISDKADDSEEMNFERFTEMAAEHSIKIIMYMISH